MPGPEVWGDFMTDGTVNTALDLAGLEYILSLSAQYAVVDIGAGYGDYLFRAGQRLQAMAQGREVRSVGIDIMDTMVDFMNSKIAAMKRTSDPPENADGYEILNRNILDEGGSQLPASSAGLVILSSMFHLPRKMKRKMLKEAERLLVPGGRILLTHWYQGYKPRGPEDSIRPRPQDIVEWTLLPDFLDKFEFVGYQRLSDGLYGLVLEKKDALAAAEDQWGQSLFRKQTGFQLLDGVGEIPLSLKDKRRAFEMELQLYRKYSALRRIHTDEEAQVFLRALVEQALHSKEADGIKALAKQLSEDPKFMRQFGEMAEGVKQRRANNPLTPLLDHLTGTNNRTIARQLSEPTRALASTLVFWEMAVAMLHMGASGDMEILENSLRFYPQIQNVIQNPPETLAPTMTALKEYLEEQGLWDLPRPFSTAASMGDVAAALAKRN